MNERNNQVWSLEHFRISQITFQWVMHLVIRGLAWDRVVLYLDDVIVLGRSFEESLGNLEIVLRRFVLHNLKLKSKMCFLFSTEVRFLGRKVSRGGGSVTNYHIQ